MATTGGGGAGAVRVRGVPSGGVSVAGAAADDMGSVIDFLSGADFKRVAFLSQAGRVLGSDEPTRHRLQQLELRETITIISTYWARGSVSVLLVGDGRVRAPGDVRAALSVGDVRQGSRPPEEPGDDM